MPELPEVETVMRGMAKVMNHKTIRHVDIFSKNLRLPIPQRLRALARQKIGTLRRRAKYILIPLNNGETVILHLGMTGRVSIDPPAAQKHDHFAITLTNGRRLVYNDARRFGLIAISNSATIASHRFFAHLGPEPFSDAFNPESLVAALAGRSAAIKTTLMDQRIVVGVGNIYAAEALFRCRLDPRHAAGEITKPQTRRLVTEIRAVLEQSITAGGSSLRDYVQTDGEMGYYQDQWRVYGRAGQPCLRRGCSGTVHKIVQSGRSTFFCPACQT